MKRKLFTQKFIKTFIAVCLLAALCTALLACSGEEEDVRTFEESWMSYISDETLVSEVVMPGSHDAGTHGAQSLWETQHSTIEQQLYAGTRYFDFRSTQPTSGEREVYFFVHADSDMPALVTACGQRVDDSMNAIKAFIERNPEEVLILDFQHTWTKTEEGLIELIENTLPMDKVLTKSDCTDPTTVTLGRMRELGKNIIIIYKDTSSDICSEHDWLFERSRYLQSDYAGSEHKGDADRLKAQWQTYFDAKKEGVFFVLQSQLTGSPLEDREAMIRPVLDDYLKNTVANDEEKLADINIVMKDFIADDVEECEISSKQAIHTIISLNAAKGNVKADKLEDFRSACGYNG